MNQIPWYMSGTLRGLLVAAVAFGLQASGLAEQFPDAEKPVDLVLGIITFAAMAYSAWQRARNPTPPVTDAAVKATAVMEAQQQESPR